MKELVWLLLYWASRLVLIAHIAASMMFMALGCFYIMSYNATWLIPFWIIWSAALSYVGHQQMNFSFMKHFAKDED